VFAGGCAMALYASDEKAQRAPAQWLDVIANSQTEMEYGGLCVALRESGFMEVQGPEGRSRWIFGPLEVHVWNVESRYSPFSSRFIQEAFKAPRRYPLDGEKLKILHPAYLLALKLEAFQLRGMNNFQSSIDLDDLIYVINARPELPFDLKLTTAPIRSFITKGLAELKTKQNFQQACKRLIPDEARHTIFSKQLSDVIRVDLGA
jgi:hypothetical protein